MLVVFIVLAFVALHLHRTDCIPMACLKAIQADLEADEETEALIRRGIDLLTVS